VKSDDYYSFGLTFNSYTRENSVKQNNLYNGKEFQDEIDMDWLDYGARMYNCALGRWSVSDLLAEVSFGQSPYKYCYNNPISFTDPFGLWEQDSNGNYSTTDAGDIARFTGDFN